MTRILFTLASGSMILLVAAAAIGFSIGDLYAQPRAPQTQSFIRWHFLLGLVAALAVVFVESVIVTYFIGTSRWCKEVVETYQLDPAFVQASNRLKRRTFPWALAGMLTVVGIIALGGASDPATGLDTEGWATWHLAGAMAGIVVITWTYVVAWNNVVANHAIINDVMVDVARLRGDEVPDQAGAGIKLPN